MKGLTFEVLDADFTVHRLKPEASPPQAVFSSCFYALTRTETELSIVCASDLVVGSERAEAGWSCLKVLGPLDFSLTGVLAGLTTALADAGISVFALSTYDTDYMLVKTASLAHAVQTLQAAGYDRA